MIRNNRYTGTKPPLLTAETAISASAPAEAKGVLLLTLPELTPSGDPWLWVSFYAGGDVYTNRAGNYMYVNATELAQITAVYGANGWVEMTPNYFVCDMSWYDDENEYSAYAFIQSDAVVQASEHAWTLLPQPVFRLLPLSGEEGESWPLPPTE